MNQMQQNIRFVFSIITSNYYVKECLRPTINGCLAPWKTLLLMIAGQKHIWTSTKVLPLSKRPVSSECRRDNITRLNKLICPAYSGTFLFFEFLPNLLGIHLPLSELINFADAKTYTII